MSITLTRYFLEDVRQENGIVSLSEGTHIIGRGNLLKVTDIRVSRKHAVIEVTKDKIILTSVSMKKTLGLEFLKDHKKIHHKPSIDDTKTVIIKENQKTELHHGDIFGLLPKDCWFKVNAIDSTGKRQLSNEENIFVSQLKRLRQYCENDNDDSAIVNGENYEQLPATWSVINVIAGSEADRQNASRKIKEEPDDCNVQCSINNVKLEPSNQNELLQAQAQTPAINNETLGASNGSIQCSISGVQTEPSEPGTSGLAYAPMTTLTNQPTRKKCRYGHNCYRINPNHRASFSHPGDQDYGDDATNKEQYVHSARPRDILPSNNSNNLTNITTHACPFCKCNSQKIEENDYDYEDTFINDESSTDYDSSAYEYREKSPHSEHELSPDRNLMLLEADEFLKE